MLDEFEHFESRCDDDFRRATDQHLLKNDIVINM